MGPDELSLLVMAKSIIDGAFPYEAYWGRAGPARVLHCLAIGAVRRCLHGAGLAEIADGLRASGGPHGCSFASSGARWALLAALIGALVLLVSTNMADLHHLAMPNHFVMGMSLAAFACLIAGIRGSRLGLFFSAFLAGVLPWVMVQSGLVTLGLAALVMFANPSLRRTERLTWFLIAVFPLVVIIGAFLLCGDHSTRSCRTVFLAPFGVIEAGLGMDWSWRWQTPSGLLGSVPWRIFYILTLIVGAVLFWSAARHAPLGFADSVRCLPCGARS